MRDRRALARGVGLGAVALTAAACGGDHHATGSAPAGRVIEISMTDMAYSPASLSVTKGETVTLRFVNNGQALHEAVIGDETYQMEHGTSMTGSTMAGMSADHGTDHGMDHGGTGATKAVTVAPGKKADLTYRFDEAGTMLIGCHQPGHYEAGMKATITVS